MSLTAAQRAAVAARGNVLVMAGAGTGKTSTLVARCIDCLSGKEAASLDELLVVTFTEAAAAEARERIRAALDTKLSETGDEHWARQLALFDAAHIGTLHGFCFQLIREHFYQLGLDPQVTVSDEGQARLLAEETLTELLEEHYADVSPQSAAVRQFIESYAGGRDESVRRLVLRLHHYSQTQPDPREWFVHQIAMFESPEPLQWHDWLLAGIEEWRGLWLVELESLRKSNPKAAECADILRQLPVGFDRGRAAQCVEDILAAKNGLWPKKEKTQLQEPLEAFFADAEFLAALRPSEAGSPARHKPEPADSRRVRAEGDAPTSDPLIEDWHWCRSPMLALLRLTSQFSDRFTARKRADGLVDFHDLEQLALQLLWEPNPRRPSAIARHWRGKLRFVFVDEYQDINAAQDQIITALSREGADANRFLVGDIKQSIYRFRLAEPGIFRKYAQDWRGGTGKTIALAENFRSRPSILAFVNAVFTPLMREAVGGVGYDAEARLIPGLPPTTLPAGADVELCLRLTERSVARPGEDEVLEELQDAEREARHVALRLQELKSSGQPIVDRDTGQTRPIEWRDMAVLLRAPSNKAEGYAKQFERAGVPLLVERGGFFEALEVADMLNLLRLLDNPLQDVPLLAVLRSPMVGLSLDQLATIRLAAKGYFWTALVRWGELHGSGSEGQGLKSKVVGFLECFARWRKLARHTALSKCLDTILAETHYAEWLRAQERGQQRYANVQRLLGLAEQYDQFQRQGLFRFLRFVEAQQQTGAEPEVAAVAVADAVRLMSIHQSKGLEFPIVVVADLGKPFNFLDLKAEVMLDEEYGLCPQVRPPARAVRYPSAAYWLARQRQRRELLGEELRLLYVALTRARAKLILTGSISRKKWDSLHEVAVTPLTLLSARSAVDWLRLWHARHGEDAGELFTFRELVDADLLAERESGSVALDDHLPPLDDETLERLRAAMAWEYPFVDATQCAAKTSVTVLRRAAAEELEAEEVFVPRFPRAAKPGATLSATDVGNAHHKFLQHVALALADNAGNLRAEAGRLQRENVLTAEEAASLDFTALEEFWRSAVGEKIRAQVANVKRELAFTARFAPDELDEIVGRQPSSKADDEYVIVQGVADLVVLLPEEIWLLDFKTDDVTKSGVEAKQMLYTPQLQLYALALERIYSRRVTERWLHFLACGETINVNQVQR